MILIRFHTTNHFECRVGIAIQLSDGSVICEWGNSKEYHVVYSSMDMFNRCNPNITITHRYEF